MAGPWEQYQQAAPVAEGPWSRYATTEPQRANVQAEEVPPWTKLGRAAASAADVLLGDLPSAIVGQVTYPVARALGQTPAEATALAQRATAPLAQPVGRAFGVAQTPEYQQEASRRLMGFIGANIEKGTNWLAKQTGLPEADVQNMVGTLTMAAPNVLAGARRPVNALAGPTATGEAALGTAAGVTANLSGKSALPYKEAYKAGQAGKTDFLDNLRGSVSPDELLTTLRQGIDKIQQDAAQSYTTAKTGWSANTTPLDFAPIDTAYSDLLQSLESKGKSIIGKEERNKVEEIGTVLDQWRSDPNARTALDFDALKRRLDAIYPDSPKQTNVQRAVTKMRNAVKDEITANVGDYADAMKSYEVQQDLLRDINKGLSTGDNVAKQTTISKLMGALKDTPANDTRRQLLSAIEQQGGVSIVPALAGQELSHWAPTSGVGRAVLGGGLTAAAYLRHPELAAILPLTSPRLMGEAYYKLGQTTGAGREAVNALLNLPPEQQAYLNTLVLQAQQQPNQNALVR